MHAARLVLLDECSIRLIQVIEGAHLRITIIRDFAENYEMMTDEKADELWMASMKYQEDLHKLKKAWYGKFKKALPAGKVVTFFQADSKIETLVNAQLALEIPLLETE